jgi:activating signal cointegrator complex subunit 3
MLHPVKGGTENAHGKTNILLQTYISNAPIKSFSLQSDSYYVAQNSARLFRGLLEIVQKKNWPTMTYRMINICKQVRTLAYVEDAREMSISGQGYESVRKTSGSLSS